MFHPYVPGSNSPFGPSPSGSPSRSTPPLFRPPVPAQSNTRAHRDADDSDSDSDRSSFRSSSEGSVYCARPAKSPAGSTQSFDTGKGKEVDFGAEVVARDNRKRSGDSSKREHWYSSDSDDEAEDDEEDDDDGYYYYQRRRSGRHRAYDYNQYYEYASPTEPLFPPTPPPAPPDFPFHHSSPAAGTPLSTSPLVSSLFPSDNTPGGSSFFNRPIFRPPTSMNRSYGSINAHPFHRAPMAERSFRDDREGEETPDELEGDQEGGWGYWSVNSGRRTGRGDGRARTSVWQGMLRGCCLVCCCIRVEDMGD